MKGFDLFNLMHQPKYVELDSQTLVINYQATFGQEGISINMTV